MADPLREARKHGTDVPARPTDEFVIHAFAEGARALWPDSRDPGWHVTFRRWLERRDAAAHAEDAARLAEARAEERADILATLERLAGNLDYSGDVNRVLRALRNVLPPLGVTAPTASEAGTSRIAGRYAALMASINPAPAEASEVEGSGCTCDQWPCEHEPLPITATITLPLDGLEETIAREVGRVLRGNGLSDKPREFDSDIHSWRCQYPDRYGPCACFQELVTDLTSHVVRALAGDGAR